jgi:DNA-binding beta-propeller fold protein YncE
VHERQRTAPWLNLASALVLFNLTCAFAQNVYVADAANSGLWVIDSATNKVVGSPIPLSNTPEGMVITPDGSQLYVIDSKIDVIDTATMTLSQVPGLGAPNGVVMSPDGSALYAVFNGNIRTISTSTNTVTNMLSLPGSTQFGQVTISTDGTTLYSIDQGAGNLFAINLATGAVVATGCVESNTQNHPTATALPNGQVYMTDNIDNTITVCDPVMGSQTSFAANGIIRWPTFNTQSNMIVSPDGGNVFTVGPTSQEINIASSSVTNSFSPNLFFQSTIALLPNGNTLYIGAGSQVYAVDVASGSTIANITVGNVSVQSLAIAQGSAYQP